MRGSQRYGRKIIIEMDLEEISEIKAIREVGVGHRLSNYEIITEGTILALGTVDQGQILEWVPIETELGVLSVESMIISQGTAQPHKQTEK